MRFIAKATWQVLHAETGFTVINSLGQEHAHTDICTKVIFKPDKCTMFTSIVTYISAKIMHKTIAKGLLNQCISQNAKCDNSVSFPICVFTYIQTYACLYSYIASIIDGT